MNDGVYRDVTWEVCDPACAEPVPCPSCGEDMPPRGRARKGDVPPCCSFYLESALNTRHLRTADEFRVQTRRLP